MDIRQYPCIANIIISQSLVLQYALFYDPPLRSCGYDIRYGNYTYRLNNFVSKYGRLFLNQLIENELVFKAAAKNPVLLANKEFAYFVSRLLEIHQISFERHSSLNVFGRGSKLSEIAILMLEYSFRTTRCDKISLWNRKIGPEELEVFLSAMSSNTENDNWSELSLRHNQPGILGSQLIAKAMGTSLRSIKKLDLSYCQIGNEGVEVLSIRLHLLQHLTCIALQGNCIDQDGMQILAPVLAALPVLVSLFLCDNDINGTSSRQLRKMRSTKKILKSGLDMLLDAFSDESLGNFKELSFNDNHLTDDSLEKLAQTLCKFEKIRQLSFRSDLITCNGFESFVAAASKQQNLKATFTVPASISSVDQKNLKNKYPICFCLGYFTYYDEGHEDTETT